MPIERGFKMDYLLLLKLQIAREGKTMGENILIIKSLQTKKDINNYLIDNRGLTLQEWENSLTWENGFCLKNV